MDYVNLTSVAVCLNHQWFLNFPVAETARCGKISRSKGFSLRVCIYFASFFNFVLWSWSKSIEANKHPLTLSVLLVNRTIADRISPSNAVRVPLEHNISWSKIAVWYDCIDIKRRFNYELVTSAKGNQTIYQIWFIILMYR